MIDRNRNGDELKEEFSVLGSTGNVRSPVPWRTIFFIIKIPYRFTPSQLTTSPDATVCFIFEPSLYKMNLYRK
jgi:hypothetical protein